MYPLVRAKPFVVGEKEIKTGNPVNNEKQIMNQLQQVKQLGPATVDLNAITKQEKSVCF